MPVKNKRNGVSRKQRIDPNPIVYSTSLLSQLSETPSTSAASSPPEPMPAFSLDIEPALSEPEPDAVRETMTDQLDPPDSTVGFAEDVFDLDGEDKSVHAIASTPPFKPSQELATEGQTILVDVSESDEHGHIRSPILAREPTTLESFSRTIRGYVPSSIPIPSVVPTPPRVSRPVSFGSFLTPIRADVSSARRRGSDADSNNWKRRGSDVSSDHRRMMSWEEKRSPVDEVEEAVFNLDEDVHEDDRSAALRPSLTTYPGTGNGEDVVCAAFGELGEGDTRRRLIMLGYQSGLQIWDCTNLGSVTEVLNLSGSLWGTVESLAVLPEPKSSGSDDVLKAQRPLIGFLSMNDDRAFVVYSLRTHEVVKRLTPRSLVSFAASSEFILLSTTEPAALLVLSSRTLRTLYTFPASALTLFAHQSPILDIHNSVSLHVDHGDVFAGPSHSATIPQPVFALSHRLLAFASAPPRPASSTQSSARTPRTATQSTFGDDSMKFPTTQTELGLAAMKIGGSLFNGMKAIGGRAYSAARAGVSAAMSGDYNGSDSAAPPGKFFSRSAPEASSHGHERPYSISSEPGSQSGSVSGDGESTNAFVPSLPQAESKDNGYYITVVDLEPLRSAQALLPTLLAEYMVSKHQPINEIEFSPDGTSLAVALKDGQTMKVFRLKPPSKILQNEVANANISQQERSSEAGLYHNDSEHSLTYPPWHIYDLRRGRTSAVVERLNWAHDGRWLAVGTRKRTIHLFALNPYGGPTDEASHLEGRVMNVGEVQPLSTELVPLVRLRLKPHPGDRILPASVFTFLHHHTGLPPSLSPPAAVASHSISSSPSSAHSSSPGQPSEPSINHQDVLVFDTRDGTLSLRRVTVTKRSKDDFSATIRAVPIANASISLPGISSMNRFTGSSSTSATPLRQPSALSRMMERSELVGQDAVVATWLLKRSVDWQEVKRPVRSRQAPRSCRRAKSEWLAQAELSTCSRSRKIVPKSIYLAHQFTFHYLDEDYHALLRSHRFDVPAQSIDVRRQVAVSASRMGMSESFVSGSSVPSQGGLSSSFDEPLASALSAELRYLNPSPPVLPMYPNGPTSTRSSGRTAIPIRVAAGISDGMSEGLGRLRREIGKVRSPKPATRGGISGSVPLEFDEEDEDFLDADNPPNFVSRSTSREGEVLSTPSTGLEPLPAEHGDGDDYMWAGWEAEDKEAVEEVEQFDDIGVGFMDEEWMKSKH